MSDDFAIVFRADSLGEAEIIKGLLVGEGILARIPGEDCADPVVTSQEMVGDVPVEVPAKDAERSRGLIEAAKEAGEKLDGWIADHPGETPGEG